MYSKWEIFYDFHTFATFFANYFAEFLRFFPLQKLEIEIGD